MGAFISILRFFPIAASSVVFPYTAIRVLFCLKSGKFLNKDSIPSGLKKQVHHSKHHLNQINLKLQF